MPQEHSSVLSSSRSRGLAVSRGPEIRGSVRITEKQEFFFRVVATQLVAHELSADSEQHLADDFALIATAWGEQEAGRETAVASTVTAGTLVADGMTEVTDLNAIVNNKYTRMREKLRAWQRASHIERTAQREKKPAAAPPNP